MRSCVLLVLALATVTQADMYDVIEKYHLPPAGGCKNWSDVPESDKYWAAGKPPPGVSNYCVQQGNGSLNSTCNRAGNLRHGAICPTSYCISQVSGVQELCTSGDAIPEQVNVQIANNDSVIVGFVTFEKSAPTAPPMAMFGTSASALKKSSEGVTEVHKTKAGRIYYMHFVRLEKLEEKKEYFYSVKSGSSAAKTSDVFSFRAPYSSGETKIALYGDMGVYQWNNMANLLKDTVKDKAYDLIIHAGDHCYNENDLDELRGDGYMQAFSKTIANVPWMPILGNHEFINSAPTMRFLDQTWEKWDSSIPHSSELPVESTADSALGAFIANGNHKGPAIHSPTPSHSSRYFSVDFGLVHLVALSLNGYNGVDTCTTECNAAQLAWLKEDLAKVDRSKTPWVVAMSHFPLYLSQKPLEGALAEKPLSQQPWYVSEECEYEGHAHNCTGGPDWTPPELNASANTALEDLEPVFYEYGVDIYWAGHIHLYETFDGPLKEGKVISNGTHNPPGVIHVCSGNGGPPSGHPCKGYTYKTCIETPYSYTHLTAYNETDLLWEQISNADNSVIDSWVVHQDKHGPFPTAKEG